VVAKRPLLKGILTLTTAGLLVRAMGMAYRVLLVRVTGSEVVGVFQMTFPLYRLCATAVSLGLPVALSRTVAESLARGDAAKVRTSFKVSFSLVLLNSIAASALLLLGAHLLSGRVLSDDRTHLAILMMPIALAFTSISGIVRGYFHGHQYATPPAIAQVVEQVVRIGVTLYLFRSLTGATVASAAAIAMLTMGIGEAAGFVTLLSMKLRWDRSNRETAAHPPAGRATATRQSAGRTASTRPPAARLPQPSNMNLISELLGMSLPLTAAGFISTASHTIDAIVIPRRLMCGGFDSAQATVLFGRLSGMAMPVLFLPGLLVFPISTLLLPEVAASRAHGREINLRRRLKQMTLLTLGITLAVSAGMLLLAHRISTILYRTDEAAMLIERYAPAVPLLYIGYVLGSALNGLGKARLVLASTAAGALVDFAVLYNTVSRPSVNIYGAIAGDMAGFALAAAINAIGLGLYLARDRSDRKK